MSEQLQTLFIDDETTFLEVMKLWQQNRGMLPRATSDVDEAVEMVKCNGIDHVVCDLKMPQKDGISVLESLRKINKKLKLSILTGYDLKENEKRRIEKIRASVYLKYANLYDLLNEISGDVQSEVDESTKLIIEQREKLEKLTRLNREWADDLIEQLKEIPHPDKASINTIGESFSVQELINDIQTLSERGIEHIRLWKNAMSRLRKARNKEL